MARMRLVLENLWSRLKSIFRPARTRWVRIVWWAWVCAVGYIAIIAGAALKRWPPVEPSVKGMLDAVFAVALMILSIRYSGVLTDFYEKLTGFGITDIRVNRHGQDPTLTELWITRISGSEDVVIVGTLSRGWFKQAGANLDNLLSDHRHVSIKVYLLDPFGTIWRGLVASGTERHSEFIDDAIEVFRTLHELSAHHGKQFLVHLYDTEPMSFVMAKGTIYLGLYLPRTSRKEVPEFKISQGSFLGQKVIESAAKLMNTAPLTNAPSVADYRHIMQEHALHTREQFWSDARVYCDFCKELRGLPCTFSRRHSDLATKRAVRLSAHSYLLPSLGPLVPGHTLLVPLQHVTSLARLKGEAFTDLVGKADDWAGKVTSQGKIPLIFEHGTPSEDTSHGGCGICHCHLHLLPMPAGSCDTFYEQLSAFLNERDYDSDPNDLESWDGLRDHAASPYIAVRVAMQPPKVMLFGNDVAVQSQLLRQFVASQLGSPAPAWDWRDSEAIDPATEKKQISACIAELKEMFTC